LITVVAIAACAMLGTSQAQASLDLTVTNSTGGSLLAITPGTTAISNMRLVGTVTGGTDPQLNAINKVFFTIYSSNSLNPVTNLTRLDLTTVTVPSSTFQTKPVWHRNDDGDVVFTPLSYGGTPPNGTATTVPTQQDCDGDGDLDQGCTGPLAYNAPGKAVGDPPYIPVPPYTGYWGGYDTNQTTYTPLDSDGVATGEPSVTLTYFTTSNSMRLANITASRTPYTGEAMGHGVTQIYAVGKPTENAWKENGVVNNNGAPTSGGALTLYMVATSHNTSLEMTINQTSSGLLNGTTSVGTMDHWIWQIRKHGTADPWVTVADVDTDTVALTLAALQAALGSDPSMFGNYDIQLMTKYASAVVLPDGPNGLPNGSTGTEQTLLHYTPEPGTMLFLAAGSAGLAFIRRRRSKK